MNDLINRQAAIDALHQQFADGFEEDRWWNSTHVLAALEGLPSAEPKTGKWIPVRSYEAFGGDKIMWEIRGNPVAFYYCSECRNDAYAGEDGESLLTKYCPNCGAKMEEGRP